MSRYQGYQGNQGDQVVPSCRGGRGAKPLPPTPDPEELMADEVAAAGEEEFFCSDRRRLLPKRGVACPGGRGLVNHAYQERAAGAEGPQKKPLVPPRAPTAPPEVPPRVPLLRPRAPPRAPAALPLYVNGVMPATQSFAPDPHYVSRAPPPSAAGPRGGGARIVPLVADGQRTSATHYMLLPSRGQGAQWGFQDR